MLQFIESLDFPIVKVLPDFKAALETEKTLILNAETGAGKSTILPLSLIDVAKTQGKTIIMLEPRRLAVKSIASRMADLLGEEVGETIGYSIRFESRKSDSTLIEIVTEGILTRMLVSDPLLSNYCMVIFDEFHERSIHADLGLALTRALQLKERPDLQIILMSATLNKSALASALKAKVINSSGRTFPVDIYYVGEAMETFEATTIAHQIKEALKKHEGDLLVFLPGQGEIKDVFQLLKHQVRNAQIVELYGQLPWHKQQRAILPHPEGKRKVVLATSIAETSLTIEGIKVVIDCGLGRHSLYDPQIGLSRLVTSPISKDEADQRSGRAGRLSSGICYRMWSATEHEYRPDHRTPEILVNDLAPLKLDLYAKGISQAHSLYWLSPPPLDKLMEAEELLEQLEAIQAGKITNLGKEMHALPCHPRLAHMLKHKLSQKNLALATDIAALLEEKDTAYKLFGADLSPRIEQLRKLRAEKRLSKGQKKIEKIAASYRKILQIEVSDEAIDPYEIGFMLSLAYPDRIASAKRGNNAQFQLANGAIAAIGHKDGLAAEAWLSVAAMDARQGLGKIFLAAPLNPKDLSPLVKQEVSPYWDFEEDFFELRTEIKIGRIILKSEPIQEEVDHEDYREAILKALKFQGEDILHISDEFESFSQQINLLRRLHPSEAWPEMGIDYIKSLTPIWTEALEIPHENTFQFLHALNLIDIGKSLLTPSQLQKLSEE